MRSSEKLKVNAKKMPRYGNKWWVFVDFNGNGKSWVPSFEDLFRVIQAICFCEDEKYPTGEGRGMVRRFLAECCAKDAEWNELRERFKVPNRDDV